MKNNPNVREFTSNNEVMEGQNPLSQGRIIPVSSAE
jgi:hypothetical protein